jgi:hypothetical protein
VNRNFEQILDLTGAVTETRPGDAPTTFLAGRASSAPMISRRKFGLYPSAQAEKVSVKHSRADLTPSTTR